MYFNRSFIWNIISVLIIYLAVLFAHNTLRDGLYSHSDSLRITSEESEDLEKFQLLEEFQNVIPHLDKYELLKKHEHEIFPQILSNVLYMNARNEFLKPLKPPHSVLDFGGSKWGTKTMS